MRFYRTLFAWQGTLILGLEEPTYYSFLSGQNTQHPLFQSRKKFNWIWVNINSACCELKYNLKFVKFTYFKREAFHFLWIVRRYDMTIIHFFSRNCPISDNLCSKVKQNVPLVFAIVSFGTKFWDYLLLIIALLS